MTSIPVRIIGHNLPGLRFCDYAPVHVAIGPQGKDVEAGFPGDAESVAFDLHVDVRPDRAGRLDWRGPYIGGGKGERALYLRWGTLAEDGTFELFRAAKLRLPPIDEARLENFLAGGCVLQVVVDLTDDRGEPICATVPSHKLTWSFVPA